MPILQSIKATLVELRRIIKIIAGNIMPLKARRVNEEQLFTKERKKGKTNLIGFLYQVKLCEIRV